MGSDRAEAWVGGLHCLAGGSMFVVVVPAPCPCISHELMKLFGFCGGQVEDGKRAAGIAHLEKYHWRPLIVLLGLCPSRVGC